MVLGAAAAATAAALDAGLEALMRTRGERTRLPSALPAWGGGLHSTTGSHDG